MDWTALARCALVLVTGIVSTGCSDSSKPNIYGCCVGQDVVGNSAYVTVSNVYNEMDALPLAEKHCAAHKKTARFNRMVGARAIFDCV